ncbi:leucine-rich repeat-containing protein 70-like isoform X2 [Anabrus simplex]|uniref:leucine-rich repeat-containing protein 70-like isoform X2 n=1 Tax=Anabrus simplex TaxID=316456 RepID=UPI0035A2B96F
MLDTDSDIEHFFFVSCFRLSTMLAVLLLWVTVLHATEADVSSVCPIGCYCPNELKADCSSRGFEEVPSHLNIGTRVLNLSNNSISKLGNDTFTSGSLPYLKVLDIHRNNIRRIDVQSFTSLDNIRFIYLEKNNLSILPKDLFITNSKLETLSLRYNPLRIPRKGPFLNIPSLLDIDISYCNISALYGKTFVSMRKLEILRASHNSLSTLSKEAFMPLKLLKQLYLSHNNISTIEYNVFSPMKLLTLLDLSHNKLKELIHLTFSGQTSLQVLYLSHNKLSSIGEDEFHWLVGLKELYLQNNSLYTIEDNLFRSAINLRTLYLDNNILTNLSRDTFSSLESLNSLYISGNRLKSFSFRWVCKLDNLTYLRVFNNPIGCDCDMKNLWNWGKEKGVSLWGTCIQKKKRIIHDNATIPVILSSLKCNVTSCDVEPVFPQIDTHLTLVYILSAVCPLLLFVLCFVCAAWVFTRHRKNARELRNRQYKAPTSSTGYLILDTLPRVQQVYSSEIREEADSLEYLKAHTEPVVIENHHAIVSPYSVSPVLAVGPCSSFSSAPPPVPRRPPSDLILSTLPQCYPDGSAMRGTAFSTLPQCYSEGNAVRGAAFSTSEEEESKPLMKQSGTTATMSKESSVGIRQPRRTRARRHPNNHSASDTEPWSSYSEGSGSVSITECDVACWSGSEASTRPASVGIAGRPDS